LLHLGGSKRLMKRRKQKFWVKIFYLHLEAIKGDGAATFPEGEKERGAKCLVRKRPSVPEKEHAWNLFLDLKKAASSLKLQERRRKKERVAPQKTVGKKAQPRLKGEGGGGPRKRWIFWQKKN